MSSHPNPSMMARNNPIPHDPRNAGASPEDIQQQFDAALDTTPSNLAEEAEMLSRAHDVLHEALQ